MPTPAQYSLVGDYKKCKQSGQTLGFLNAFGSYRELTSVRMQKGTCFFNLMLVWAVSMKIHIFRINSDGLTRAWSEMLNFLFGDFLIPHWTVWS